MSNRKLTALAACLGVGILAACTQAGWGEPPQSAGGRIVAGQGAQPVVVQKRLPAPARLNFSEELTPYPVHPTARSRSIEEIYRRTTNPATPLPEEYSAARKRIIAMYRDFGIDLSLEKSTLIDQRPARWSLRTPQPLEGTYPQPYSVDSPFYQKIPAQYPRVEVPAGYFKSGHLSTLGPEGDGSDGFGIGVVIAGKQDPVRTLSLQRENQYAKMGTCPDHNPYKGYNQSTRIPDRSNRLLGGDGIGIPSNRHDRAVVWLDGVEQTTISTWMSVEDCNKPAAADEKGRSYEATRPGGWSAMWITGKERLPNLGDRGGVNAAGKADLVTLIRPGEATDPNKPIPHALSGPTLRAWKAIVYPASNTDNSIDGHNNGLLGYGMLVQLDPNLDLRKLKLSLPARRILEAIQTYGWYMDDTGVRDFDIKGNLSARELAPYGGPYGIDREVLDVVQKNRMYIVAPLVKRES